MKRGFGFDGTRSHFPLRPVWIRHRSLPDSRRSSCLSLVASFWHATVALNGELLHSPLWLRKILFPLLYYTLLSISSDWRVWPWYRYPLVASSVAAVLLLLLPPQSSWLCLIAESSKGWRCACILTLCALFGNALRKPPQNTPVYEVALRLQEFAKASSGSLRNGRCGCEHRCIHHRPTHRPTRRPDDGQGLPRKYPPAAALYSMCCTRIKFATTSRSMLTIAKAAALSTNPARQVQPRRTCPQRSASRPSKNSNPTPTGSASSIWPHPRDRIWRHPQERSAISTPIISLFGYL